MTESELDEWLLKYKHIWKTKPEFFTWLRGCLRRGIWEKSPVKLSFKNSMLVAPPVDYVGRAKRLGFCQLSREWFPASYLEVDHVDGNKSLQSIDDIVDFVLHLACPDELQVVSKEAHKIKSYAERMDISYEEALLIKKAIQIEKGDWRSWLAARGKSCLSKEKRSVIVDCLRGDNG